MIGQACLYNCRETYGTFHPGWRITNIFLLFLFYGKLYFSVIFVWNIFLCVSIDNYSGEVHNVLFLRLNLNKTALELGFKTFFLKFGCNLKSFRHMKRYFLLKIPNSQWHYISKTLSGSLIKKIIFRENSIIKKVFFVN